MSSPEDRQGRHESIRALSDRPDVWLHLPAWAEALCRGCDAALSSLETPVGGDLDAGIAVNITTLLRHAERTSNFDMFGAWRPPEHRLRPAA